MAILSPYSSSFLDTLFCNEDQDHPWSLDHDHEDEFTQTTLTDSSDLHSPPLDPLDLFWEHEELVSLFTKEQDTPCTFSFDKTGPSVFAARKEAVDWILKVKCYYGFTPLTAILAINYLDRFLSSLHFENDKPWMTQLVAVSCLSLAAKIQETQVPLLLDLQVENTKFLFEAKNIQKMELLVMSTLKWRMNPVTPISFLDHIVRRLGLTDHVHWDFFKKCETLILCLISDSRFMCYKPSVLATAAMLRVVDEIDPPNSVDYKSQLLDLLKTTKDDIDECYELITDNFNKRKHDANETTTYPVSPAGVIDFTCDESSNDSCEFNAHTFHEPSFKKTRVDQPLGFGFGSLISFNRG
ncbi:hypothetical protein L1987_19464 [Smallanthus sonchifolius]|uniref:Uncharacterized protein n=1 Tax=Smallanthus sonchifolius TaxID=185202 RepID=A0ACB9IS43_9ASTR|nr:hypothetical protein L1987_19464 [Smallanthus sonchifolius]